MLVIAAFAVTSAAAQFNPQQPIPADKDVRTGKLENGMTYYIRHNESRKDRPTSTFCTTSAPFRRTIPSRGSPTSSNTWPSTAPRTSPARC